MSFGAACVAHFGDWASTLLALELGGWETNPDIRAMLEAGGFGLFFLFKAGLLACAYVLGRFLASLGAPGIASAMFGLAAIPGFIVTAQNLLVSYSLVSP